MGLFDSLKNMFAHHEHHHGASIGQPLTLADAKVLLAFIVVHQHLGICARWPRRSNSCRTRCRNLSRLACHITTANRSACASSPRAASSSMRTPSPPRSPKQCKIHHLMGDIEDNREHRDPTTTPAVPIDELVQITQEKLADTTDEADRRAWLFALFDQLDDIDEATKHNLEPLANALHTALHIDGNNASAVTDSDIRTHIIAMIVDLLFPASESDESDNASPASRALMLDSTTVSLDYMPAIEILRNHGLTIAGEAD